MDCASDATINLALASPPRTATILWLANLSKVREQGDVRFELEVPDFRLRAGQFVAVVGASGCGKSTLLDMLALVLQPTRCDVFWLAGPDKAGQGTDVRGLWINKAEARLAEIRRRQMGYVLQSGGLLPFLSIEENIRLPVRILGGRITRDEIAGLAKRIGIQEVLSKKPQYLSGGQRQRAAILRALVHNPGIVLADEPTGAVDKARAQAIVAEFQSLASNRSTTIVMVTHDHDLVRDVADTTYAFDVNQMSDTVVRSVCRLQP